MARLPDQQSIYLQLRSSSTAAVRAASPTIRCREATARLWEYLDGELDTALAAAVRVHVGGCRLCGVRHDARRSFLAALARSGQAEMASAALGMRVAQVLRDRGLAS